MASACPAVDAAVGVEVGGAAADAGLNCSSSCDFAGGIAVGCATRFQYGINFAWDQFAGDFGGISAWGAPGVSHNGRVRCELADMRAHGVDTIRWWVWPDFRGDGVAFDGARDADRARRHDARRRRDGAARSPRRRAFTSSSACSRSTTSSPTGC